MVSTSLRSLIPSASADGVQLMAELLSWDPQKRPTTLQVSAWMHGVYSESKHMQVHAVHCVIRLIPFITGWLIFTLGWLYNILSFFVFFYIYIFQELLIPIFCGLSQTPIIVDDLSKLQKINSKKISQQHSEI